MKKETILNIFTDMPRLKTERLLLRSMCESDAYDMYCYAKREDVTEYLLWSPHSSISYTKEYLKYVENRYKIGDFYDWAIVNCENMRMIGTCGFTKIDTNNNCGEIGYVINPEYRGRGFAPEAATAVIGFGFSTLGLHRIEAKFMAGNTPSCRVMEKLGMTFEGFMRESMLVKGSYRTVGVCSILKNEFR
ncbi:MAG: GNAT family N-acetyltransferase [Eubacteriales bacterium]